MNTITELKQTLNIEPHDFPDQRSESYNKYKDLDLDTTLTLREFIQLFNEDNENPFWDMFFIQQYNQIADNEYTPTDNYFDVIKIDLK